MTVAIRRAPTELLMMWQGSLDFDTHVSAAATLQPHLDLNFLGDAQGAAVEAGVLSM